MDESFIDAGPHSRVEVLSMKDVNGRHMVACRECDTYAHAFTEKQAIDDLSKCACNPYCANCKNLRHSTDTRPAVPLSGTCNDETHICPNDGNRWWQSNDHFHLWQQITNDEEWENILIKK